MTKIRIMLLLPLLLAGCAYRAKHYDAPSNAAVLAAAAELRTDVAQAKTTAARAQVEVNEIAEDSSDEGALITSDSNKIALLLRAAPPELRDAVVALQKDNTDLTAKHADLAAKVVDVQKVQSAHQVEMEKVIPAAESKLASTGADYFAKVDDMADKLNAAEQAHAADSARIVSLETQSLLFKILVGLGGLATAILLFLWFTGRLASAGAQIAAKIP